MEILLKVLNLVLFIGTAVVSVWSVLKASKAHEESLNLSAIYYMLMAILFFFMNRFI